MEVKDAAQLLAETLGAIPDLPNTTDPGASMSPPYTIVGPPALTWEAGCGGPTSARFLVYVVVAADAYALPRLWDLVTQVAEAVDGLQEAVVLRADPGSWTSGGTDLPAYTVEVDVAL